VVSADAIPPNYANPRGLSITVLIGAGASQQALKCIQWYCRRRRIEACGEAAPAFAAWWKSSYWTEPPIPNIRRQCAENILWDERRVSRKCPNRTKCGSFYISHLIMPSLSESLSKSLSKSLSVESQSFMIVREAVTQNRTGMAATLPRRCFPSPRSMSLK
jgi:hypothetical protein